jgi:hypothetical protein
MSLSDTFLLTDIPFMAKRYRVYLAELKVVRYVEIAHRRVVAVVTFHEARSVDAPAMRYRVPENTTMSPS